MFLKFFITFDDDSKSGSATAWNKSIANPQGTYQLPESSRNSFSSVLHSLAYKVGYVNDHDGFGANNTTREILINVDDEAMFQLMTLAVPEYCYCTYNLESKKIGFGMSKRQASNATTSYFTSGSSTSSTSGSTSGGSWFAPYIPVTKQMFSFVDRRNEEHLEFQAPEAFYAQVYELLEPYIKFEKQFFFAHVSNSLHMNTNRYSDYLEKYYDDRASVNVYKVDVRADHIVQAVVLYQNDDPDIVEMKETHALETEFIKSLCIKIMQISNETF